MEEAVGRKGRRKSRPIKLAGPNHDDDVDEGVELSSIDQWNGDSEGGNLIIAEDKENDESLRKLNNEPEEEAPCSICTRTFQSKLHLQIHLRLHTNGSGFPCEICRKTYASKNKLKRHQRCHVYTTTSSRRPKLCACGKCLQVFSSVAELANHQKLHGDVDLMTLVCKLCDQVYTGVDELKIHLKIHHGMMNGMTIEGADDDTMMVDDIQSNGPLSDLDSSMLNKNGVNMDIGTDDSAGSSIKHEPGSQTASKRKTSTPKKLGNSPPTGYNDCESEESGSEFDDIDSPGITEDDAVNALTSMKRHIYTPKPDLTLPRLSNGNPAELEKRYFIKNEQEVRIASAHRNSLDVHICSHCGQPFQGRHRLDEHIRVLHCERSDSPASFSSKGSIDRAPWPLALPCEVCHCLMKNTNYLQRHLQRKHHDGVDYFCPKCSEKHATLTGLVDHVRASHPVSNGRNGTADTAYCSECNEHFTSKLDLQLHLRKHRLHACHFCSKQFTMLNKLQRHLRRHTGEKPYSCEFCAKKFTRSDNLQTHILRMHGIISESFPCKLCKKRFNTEEGLVDHSRIHTGEKPYKCKVCARTFVWVSGLRKHMSSHADTLPYGCKVCGDRYDSQLKLNEHLKLHLQGQKLALDDDMESGSQLDDDEDSSVESGISDHESYSGPKHYCGLCTLCTRSMSALALHMDTDHHGVDKRRLWDLLIESLLADKPTNGRDGPNLDGIVCVQPTDPESRPASRPQKVLTPINDNKIEDKKPALIPTSQSANLPMLYNPIQPMVLNTMQPALLVGGLNSWYTLNANNLDQKKAPLSTPTQAKDYPRIMPKQQENAAVNLSKHDTSTTTAAVDLTAKKTYPCEQCNTKLPSNEELEKHRKSHETILSQAKFRCQSCPAAFDTEENLDAHTRNHEGNAQARCYICNQDMPSQTDLLKHLMLHRHTSYHCRVCGKSLSSWSKFEAHMGTHDTGAKFACCFCDIQFMEKVRLVQHLNDVHDRDDSQICGACGKIYFDSKLLNDHMQEHEADDMTPVPTVKPQLVDKAEDQAIECEFCPLVFDGVTSLTDHMITHKNVDAEQLSTAIQNVMMCHAEQLVEGAQTNGPRLLRSSVPRLSADLSPPNGATQPLPRAPFPCDVCEKSFATKAHLTLHARTHDAGDKPFRCSACEKTFRTSSKLARHAKTHTGEAPHVCTICSKKFARKDNLKAHLNSAHSQNEATQCSKCSKSFETPYALRQHMRWHTDKKYECSVCGTSFTWKCYLTRHMKSRHPEMAEF